MEYRHHLHPAQARVRIPDSDHRLVQPPDTRVATLELAVVGLLRGGAAGGCRQVRLAGGVQYRPGLPIHFGKVHEVLRGRKLHDEAVDGRQGPLAGQRVYREVLAHAQVRGRLSEGLHGHEGML